MDMFVLLRSSLVTRLIPWGIGCAVGVLYVMLLVLVLPWHQSWILFGLLVGTVACWAGRTSSSSRAAGLGLLLPSLFLLVASLVGCAYVPEAPPEVGPETNSFLDGAASGPPVVVGGAVPVSPSAPRVEVEEARKLLRRAAARSNAVVDRSDGEVVRLESETGIVVSTEVADPLVVVRADLLGGGCARLWFETEDGPRWVEACDRTGSDDSLQGLLLDYWRWVTTP